MIENLSSVIQNHPHELCKVNHGLHFVNKGGWVKIEVYICEKGLYQNCHSNIFIFLAFSCNSLVLDKINILRYYNWYTYTSMYNDNNRMSLFSVIGLTCTWTYIFKNNNLGFDFSFFFFFFQEKKVLFFNCWLTSN